MFLSKLINLAELFPADSKRRAIFSSTVQRPLEALLDVGTLNKIYENSEREAASGDDPHGFAPILRSSQVDYEIASGSLDMIPANGPVIVVANHPFGGIDGIILGDLLKQRRPDAKLMGNFLLKKIPLISDDIIAVDPFKRTHSKQNNRAGMVEALRFLKEGNCMGAFPAGVVSHKSWKYKGVRDGEWHASLARLAQKTGATVVPVHFEGQNSELFHRAGLIYRQFRTALLMREYTNKVGSTVRLHIGKAIQPTLSAEIPDPGQLAKFYQLRSEVLAHRCEASTTPELAHDWEHEVAERGSVNLLAAEVAALPESALLVDRGSFKVFFATGKEIPHLLNEIGRTRELTFRAVGEGTGKPLDLDQYDQHYDHLFLWNDETCEIVGAYRLGKVDQIVKEHGYAGLYSNTIFEYSDDAFDAIGKVLELGRSYIVPKYQRKGTSLFLLWKGIMSYVLKSDGYMKLFGAVSISDDYQPLSKGLILQFLRTHKMHQGFADKITPRKSPEFEKMGSLRRFDYPGALPKLEAVSSLVEEIEPDAKGVPTLLKHYLQLNGVILSFGVDEGFSDALDGFIMVDLDRVDPKVLAKYGDTRQRAKSPAAR